MAKDLNSSDFIDRAYLFCPDLRLIKANQKYLEYIEERLTEEVQNRKRTEEINEELKKNIEMKDEFLSFISHELKTPLSIITSAVQTIEIVCKNELPDIAIKYLNKIRQNSYRQFKLVNNILDNTRMNSGHFKLNQTKVNIVHLTKTITESIVVFAERKNIIIAFSSTMPKIVIEMDVDQYERILLNLLSNAVKFTPEGKSIDVNVFQILVNGNHKVCIQVKDNGIGIPNDKKELIFERFGQVDRIIDRPAEGSGIGLYLVKMLVSSLNGEVKLESKEGVGSTFSLLFPIAKLNKTSIEQMKIETPDEQLITASAIEFSDIYYPA